MARAMLACSIYPPHRHICDIHLGAIYVGATHFFNTNFAIDATIGQDEEFFGDSYMRYDLSAVLQF